MLCSGLCCPLVQPSPAARLHPPGWPSHTLRISYPAQHSRGACGRGTRPRHPPCEGASRWVMSPISRHVMSPISRHVHVTHQPTCPCHPSADVSCHRSADVSCHRPAALASASAQHADPYESETSSETWQSRHERPTARPDHATAGLRQLVKPSRKNPQTRTSHARALAVVHYPVRCTPRCAPCGTPLLFKSRGHPSPPTGRFFKYQVLAEFSQSRHILTMQ